MSQGTTLSTSAVRTSHAATADDMTAVQRLRQSLRGIRNDTLAFADEHGYEISLERDYDAGTTAAAPTEEVDLAVERAEEQIVTQRSTDVHRLQGSARDAATRLLGE